MHKIAIIGLGYVGLPLAVEFGKIHNVVGFDINKDRVAQLLEGRDSTGEVSSLELKAATKLTFSCDLSNLSECNVYIVTVPTPIDNLKQPDLLPLTLASETIGRYLKKNDVVIYESTVYPGATEEKCVPILEQMSGLLFNKDFYVGYSPERINPGDKSHRLVDIVKVTSGSTIEIANFVDNLYRKIIRAGTYQAPSIKVAEAAKVIENTQRDLNIALVNELSIIFQKLGLDTAEVLKAAATKWNFLQFSPGLVGGHCIGVDPYYLTYKAQDLGYEPEIILAGRRMNDGMAHYVASLLAKTLISKDIDVPSAEILVMGVTFKENCPDIRNTKVVDLIKEMEDYGMRVDVMDPRCSPTELQKEHDIKLLSEAKKNYYDAVILAVNHDEFQEMGSTNIKQQCKEKHVFFDLKSTFKQSESDIRL